MARYRVPDELEAGVYRAGVGMFKPGDEYEVPDAATPLDENGKPMEHKPHHLLEPLDAEADALLVKAHPKRAEQGTLKRFGVKPKAGKSPKADNEAAKAAKAGIDKADGPLYGK